MKIELEEEDKAKVLDRVTEKLFEYMTSEVRTQLTKILQEDVVLAMRAEVRKHVEEILPGMVLPGGLTFRQYIEGALTRRGQPEGRHMRSRLEEIVQSRIYHEAENIFKEVVRPHIDKLREGILVTITEKVFQRLHNPEGG